MILEFEAFVRSVLACGCSGRQARDTILLIVGFLLPAALAVPLSEEVPTVRWFVNQREALGLEAAVYAFMAVGELFLCLLPQPSSLTTVNAALGACDEVVQWGFDETTLDGTSVFNQWCLIRTGIRFGLVFFPCLVCLVFLGHISSSDDSAAIPEMGQMCVGANASRSHPHICALFPELQPHHPTKKWAIGQHFVLVASSLP